MQAGNDEFHGGASVEPLRDLRNSPEKDDDAEDQPGQPGLEDFGAAVFETLAGFGSDVFALGVEDALGFPEAQEGDEHDDGGGGGDDGHQRGAIVSGHEPLGEGEGEAGDEDGRPDFEHGAEAGIGPDQPEGNHHAEEGQDDGDGFGEGEEVETGDAVQGDDGNAEGAEGHGSGVGEQRESGGLKGTEAEADEDGSADGDGSAEAGGAFKEGAEGEGDEEELQAAVVGDVGEAFLEGDELAGLDREVVEKDDGENDPADGEEAVAGAVGERR